MTTNFDNLIEQAYLDLAGPGTPPLKVAVFDEDFPLDALRDLQGPSLWKLRRSDLYQYAAASASFKAWIAAGVMRLAIVLRGYRRARLILWMIATMHSAAHSLEQTRSFACGQAC